jgi:hypothetical protein
MIKARGRERGVHTAQGAGPAADSRPATTGGKLAQRSIRDFLSPPLAAAPPRRKVRRPADTPQPSLACKDSWGCSQGQGAGPSVAPASKRHAVGIEPCQLQSGMMQVPAAPRLLCRFLLVAPDCLQSVN